MSSESSNAAVSVVAAAAYVLLRALSTSKLAESIASGLLLAAALFILLHRKRVVDFGHVGRLFVPAANAWLSAAAACAFAGMGVLRHGIAVHTGVLDAVFAFLLLLAFGSFFGQKAREDSNDRDA